MELILTEEEAGTLRGFLHDQLRDLQFEVARTEVKAFRHTLVTRQELVERLLKQLDRQVKG